MKTFARSEKCLSRKTTLNPWAFQNSPECPPSCLSFLYPKVTGFLEILWHKRGLTGNVLVASQVEMRKDEWIPEVEAEVYRLIYGKDNTSLQQ